MILSLVAAVHAQEIPERKTDRPAMHDRMHQKMKGGHSHHEMMKELNLTDAQKEQMKTQRESFRKQFEELKKNDNITVKEWKGKMEGLRKEQKTKMDAILTSEQKIKMEKLKVEGKARHEEMRKQMAEKMKTQLGLSADQSAKMDKTRAEMEQQMKTLREDKALTDEQRKDKMKDLMKQRKENMKSILTKEQLQKMKELKQHHPGMKGTKREPKETI